MADENKAYTNEEIEAMRGATPDWRIVEEENVNRLKRDFGFDNFADALDFVNKIGEVAEKRDHHPSIVLEWGKVSVTWWTHTAEGLTDKDFDSAQEVDGIYSTATSADPVTEASMESFPASDAPGWTEETTEETDTSEGSL